MNYHAHIYWSNAVQREHAMEIRTYLHNNGCALGRIWDKPIGPHPLPMYQVMYDSSIKNCVETFLYQSHHHLSILIHEDIGVDHVRDHTEGAWWIGAALDLDLDFLRRLE